MRVELSRQDIHAGDLYGLERVVEVPDQMQLSELLVTVIEPFVPHVRGLSWSCRAEVRNEWADLAETGSIDGRPDSRLLIANEALADVALSGTLQIGCSPVWTSGAP